MLNQEGIMAGSIGNQNAKGCKTNGKPKSIIDWELFKEMCHIHCTQVEICAILKVDHETLGKHIREKFGIDYLEAYSQFSCGGKKSLRRIQFEQAEKNCSMAIWLGKQWLGQKDQKDVAEALQEHMNLVALAKTIAEGDATQK